MSRSAHVLGVQGLGARVYWQGFRFLSLTKLSFHVSCYRIVRFCCASAAVRDLDTDF